MSGGTSTFGGEPTDGAMALLFARNPKPMWIFDSETLAFLDVNDAAVDAYGYPREQFLAMRITDIRNDSDVVRLDEHLGRAAQGLLPSSPWLHRRADGSTIEVEITSQSLRYGERSAVLVVAEDVTERNRLEARIRELEERDPLTGLANRGVVVAELDRWIADHTAEALVGVVHVDLNRLANLGRAGLGRTGLGGSGLGGSGIGRPEQEDGVLRDAAVDLRSLGDDFITVGRVDDEIVAAARVAHKDGSVALAERVRTAIEARPGLQSRLRLTCGVAVAAVADASGETLVRDAMAATRWAAGHRRGGVATSDEVLGFLAVEDDLRSGIDNDELVAHYQPVVSVSDLRIVGAEALVRWQRPGVGMVPPAEFIPVAEDSGLIAGVWRWVLREAFGRAVGWQAAGGLPFSMAVNLSARQFDDPATIDHFVEALSVSTLDPNDITIEVTETAAASDPDRMHEILSAFRLLHVRIALDDFGTGYSTLAYLERTPFDALKVDRSFISRIDSDRRQRSIVSGMVKLAHGLGMTVVAEGVETEDQLARLSDLGVDLAQGYHLGRPVDAAAFSESLAHHWTARR